MLKIKEELIEKINTHGEESYNEECCGALIGTVENGIFNVTELLQFKNEKTGNRERRYLISPKEYMRSEKTAADKNLNLLGFYHSHPDHPAVPSKFDTDHALPWFVYIIVSVNNKKAEKITSWKLKEDRSSFDEIKIERKL